MFVLKIDNVSFLSDAGLLLSGRLRDGRIATSQLIRMPTTLGVDVVAPILLIVHQLMPVHAWRDLDVAIDVHLLNCWYRPELIRRDQAESTLFRQNEAVDRWLQDYTTRHGGASIYSE